MRCARGIELVGLIATRHTTGSPLEIPPSIPPCRFVSVRIAGEPEHRGERQQRLPEVRLQLVEHRLAEARRHSDGHEFAHAADRVAVLPHVVDQLFHSPRRVGYRTPHRVRFHLFERHGGGVRDVGGHITDPRYVPQNPYPRKAEHLLGDRPRRHSAHRLAGAAPPAAAVVAEAVLRVEGVIGVAGAVLVLDVAVVGAALVGVAEEEADRGSVGFSVEDARPDLRRVGLVALRGQFGLTGPAAGEVGQKILDGEFQSGRAAVDNTEIPGAVTDAGRGDPEQLAERVACQAAILGRGRASAGG